MDSAELGRTYMREHVFVMNPEIIDNYPQEWGSEDDQVTTMLVDVPRRLFEIA